MGNCTFAYMGIDTLLAQLPEDFSDNSRVWIFQSNRPFGQQEELEINEQLAHFYLQWKSHGKDVKGWGKLLFGRFIIIIADEAASNLVSGCSTDGMFRVIKSLERQYPVQLFERMSLMFLVNGKTQMLPYQQLQYAADNGFISPETLYFNNTITNFAELKNNWIVPIGQSWLATRIQFPQKQD